MKFKQDKKWQDGVKNKIVIKTHDSKKWYFTYWNENFEQINKVLSLEEIIEVLNKITPL
jgi:hypothetical protein